MPGTALARERTTFIRSPPDGSGFRRARLLRISPLVGLGAISYSLYLIHNAAGRSLIARLQDDGVATDGSVLLILAMMIVAAIALTFLVERPAQRAINGWYRRRRSALALHA